MATTFLEPGGDADFGFSLWSATVGPPTIATDFVHGGHIKSIKYAAGAGQKVVSAFSVIADAGGRISFYLYVNAIPTGGDATFLQIQDGSGNTCFMFVLSTAGVFKLTDAAFTQIGSNGATLATGKWYRISLAYTVTSTTVNTIKAFVNGAISISVTNGTITRTGTSRIILGNNDTNAALDLRSSDHYIDNSSALTDPGDIWVTAKRPNANGTTNGFTTQIGAGGSGYGTGHSPQVNERANSDSNGWSITTAGSAVTEEYNIESAATGDINIAGMNLVDYMGWVRTKALLAETGQIIINNVSTNISITTSIAVFTQIAGSTSYPAGTGKDIGEITSTTVTTVSLYECGIVIAYIPPPTGFAAWANSPISQPIIANDIQLV